MQDLKHKRKPVSNYFIKPGLQFKLAAYFVITALLTSWGSLALIFILVRMQLDGLEGLNVAWYYLKNLYPGFVVVIVVTLFVSSIIGLYAARKVVLPIFKVEQWAQNLRDGNLNYQLGMRDNDYWKEMAEICNEATDNLKEELLTLDAIQEKDEEALRKTLSHVLSNYKYKS